MMVFRFDKRKAIIVLGIILVLIGFVFILVLVTSGTKKQKEVLKDITGTVIVSDSNYVIMESQGNDYVVSNIKGTYRVGDEVKFSYLESEVDENDSLKKIKIRDEELIKVLETNDKDKETDKVIDEEAKLIDGNAVYKEPLSIKDNENREIDNNLSSKEVLSEKEAAYSDMGADAMVLEYFGELDRDFEEASVGEKLKSNFVKVIDFLFYDGKINGYTFKDLSSSAKLKVLAMALYFDQKIEKYFPGYKESISSTTNKIYTNTRNLIVKSYLETTTSVCSNNKELCSEAKEVFGNLKTNLGLTWDLIKDVASDGIGNLKNWYEIWRG